MRQTWPPASLQDAARPPSWRVAATEALLQADQGLGKGWLGRLAGPGLDPAATLSLEQRNFAAHPAVADFGIGALGADIARNGPRFAMIIDSDLRCHRALRYRLPGELPSPLELIGWAVAMRKRDREEPSMPCRSPPAGIARYAIAQARRN